MKKSRSKFIIYLVVIFIWSCAHQGTGKDPHSKANGVLQQDDGTVSLRLDKAACYCDKDNPSNNTAEWNVVISKPGHFKVWLSSATKDTLKLGYVNSVRINLMDEQLSVNPACDKIIRKSNDVPSPYFRTDSYMGSFYFSEPGEYNIQVISEKVIAKNSGIMHKPEDDIMMMSVTMIPMTP